MGCLLADVERVLDHHAELGAPVPEMRGADDGMAEMLEHPHDGIAHHGGPQMADVQFLRDVWARVVHDDPLRWRCPADAEARVVKQAGRLRRDPVVTEGEVNKAWPADLD